MYKNNKRENFTFEEIEDFEISLVIYNSETFDDLFTSDVVTLHFGE